jgi:hypothetical protein
LDGGGIGRADHGEASARDDDAKRKRTRPARTMIEEVLMRSGNFGYVADVRYRG